jgi:uncharacterized membrane protein YbhN (UPF0104 family)
VRIAVQGTLATLIFGFLVFTVARQWSELQEKGVDFDLIWLIPAFLALVPFYALNALGWDLILRSLGYRLSPVRAQVAWGQPLLARYVPGSVLYLLGRLVLSEREGVPRRICLASIVYEQALSAAAAVSIASYFFISHPDLEDAPWRWAVLAVVPLALLALQPRVFGPLADRALAAFGRDPLPRTLSPRAVMALFAFYLGNWAVIGVGAFFVARSVHGFGLDDLPTVASAQAIGFLAALLSLVAPAGLGVRDAAFAWAVKATLPSRSFAVGAVIAIAVRAVLTVVEVIYVALVTAIARRLESRSRSEPELPAPTR